MNTTDECWIYAKECTRLAAEAKTEDEREAFLGMAKQWVAAALRIGALSLSGNGVAGAAI